MSEDNSRQATNFIIDYDAPILVTGGAGFIGSRVVQNLLERGYKNIRCFTRRKPSINAHSSSSLSKRESVVEWIHGDLHSISDCEKATKDVQLVIHLAAGTGTKSYADAFLNSVVTTRNLLDAIVKAGTLKRFVNISSFAVYTNRHHNKSRLLDESSPIVTGSEQWRDAYTYAKIKQDQLVIEYAHKYKLPYVLIRPGAVYGPGKNSITGRVGLSTFGPFFHLGGSNKIPFTYVDNCADAIVLAGLQKNITQKIFNVVDDDLPTSRQFLRNYKKNVKSFRSIYIPHIFSYVLCYLWEKYSIFSKGQLPQAFHRALWHAQWKKTKYSNSNLKTYLNWSPKIRTAEGMNLFFNACKKGTTHA